jgi:chromosome segregation ATPase
MSIIEDCPETECKTLDVSECYAGKENLWLQMLLTEKDKQIQSQKTEIKRIKQEKTTEIKRIKKEAKNELFEVRQEKCEEVARLKEEIEIIRQEKHNELTRLKEEMEIIRQEKNSELARLIKEKEEKEEEISKLKEEIECIRKEKNEEVSVLKEEIMGLLPGKNIEITRLNEEITYLKHKEYDEIARLNEEISQLKKDKREEVDYFKTEFLALKEYLVQKDMLIRDKDEYIKTMMESRVTNIYNTTNHTTNDNRTTSQSLFSFSTIFDKIRLTLALPIINPDRAAITPESVLSTQTVNSSLGEIGRVFQINPEIPSSSEVTELNNIVAESLERELEQLEELQQETTIVDRKEDDIEETIEISRVVIQSN